MPFGTKHHGRQILRELHAHSLNEKAKALVKKWGRRFVKVFGFSLFFAAGLVSAAQLTSIIQY